MKIQFHLNYWLILPALEPNINKKNDVLGNRSFELLCYENLTWKHYLTKNSYNGERAGPPYRKVFVVVFIVVTGN